MRSLKMLLCCGALAAIFVAASSNAQEWTKTTYFTFSNPVQLPGMTLEAGEYMFRLADPETGRRVIGVWDKEGSKFYGMLQTRIQERAREAEDSKDSVIMFRESPAGEPQAVRSYVYANERSAYEFIYPREQASKIAKANQTAVLASESGGFGQVDQTGTFATSADAASATATASTASTTTTTAQAAPPAEPAPVASTAPAPATATTASTAQAPASTVTNTATATTTTAAAAPEPAPAPAPAATAPSTTAPEPVGLTARAAQDEPRPVGTAGQAALPQTASSLAMLQLIGGLSLFSALAVRRFRMRFDTNV